MAKIMLVGDSIMHGIYQRFSVGSYHTREHICYAGATALTQLAEWQNIGYAPNPWYGVTGPTAPDIFYIQLGSNDILYDSTPMITIRDRMITLVNSIRANTKPSAVLWMGKITPCKVKMGGDGSQSYLEWQTLNGYLQGIANTIWTPTISDALNDGSDNIIPTYAHGDGWHLSPAGDLYAATVLRGMLEAFEPTPPNPPPPIRPALAIDRRFS